jgi:hypothetical protein
MPKRHDRLRRARTGLFDHHEGGCFRLREYEHFYREAVARSGLARPTYWAVDHVDNRVAMSILGFDTSDRIVKQIEKQGARYIWQMTLDQTNETLTCFGQANNTITVSLAEIQMT